uniref:Uncharacterized protein n=1 Tax=Thermorudis peleae TaxID=1382356 RepID=A0A831TFS9_9BACT
MSWEADGHKDVCTGEEQAQGILIFEVLTEQYAKFDLLLDKWGGLPGLPWGDTDTVRVCWDLDGSTTCDPDEPEIVVPVTWAEQPRSP